MTDRREDPEFRKRWNPQVGFVAQLVLDAFLVGVWAVSGGSGRVRPRWVLGGSGAAMVLGLWTTSAIRSPTPTPTPRCAAAADARNVWREP